MSSVSIVIPFRTQNNDRDDLLDFVVSRYVGHFPDWELIVSDSDHEEFNRSAARNRGVEQASGDTIILADGDTIINKRNLENGVTLSTQHNSWVLPYNDRGYWNLSHDFTYHLLNQDRLADVSYNDDLFDYEHRIESWAGVLILPREAFDRVNGYDERFKGWGYEDNAFRMALDCLWGPYRRPILGDVFHLWHNIPLGTTFDGPDIDYNRGRFYNNYARFKKDRERMTELVKGNR